MDSVVGKSTDYGVRDRSVPQLSYLQNGDEQSACCLWVFRAT